MPRPLKPLAKSAGTVQVRMKEPDVIRIRKAAATLERSVSDTARLMLQNALDEFEKAQRKGRPGSKADREFLSVPGIRENRNA